MHDGAECHWSDKERGGDAQRPGADGADDGAGRQDQHVLPGEVEQADAVPSVSAARRR